MPEVNPVPVQFRFCSAFALASASESLGLSGMTNRFDFSSKTFKANSRNPTYTHTPKYTHTHTHIQSRKYWLKNLKVTGQIS